MSLMEDLDTDYAVEAPDVPEDIRKMFTVTVAGQPIGGETTQKPEQDPAWGMPEDAIVPPVAPDALARLTEINGLRRSIIEALSLNTVGLGIEIVPNAQGGTTPTEDISERAAELLDRLDACSARDMRMDSPSFIDHLKMVKYDEEECGLGALEVSRNTVTKQIDGFFYVPGKRVRRKRNRDGWLMLSPTGSNMDVTWFSNFGERVEYDDNGEPVADGEVRSPNNELLVFRLFNTESRDYGLPRDVALVQDYYGDKLAGESNVGFFSSGGVPPSLVFIGSDASANDVTGRIKVSIAPSTVKAIGRTVKSDAQHSHKVALLPLPPGGKVEHVKLGEVPEKDIGYVTFRNDVKKRQHAAFRLAPVFTASFDEVGSGRYTVEIQRSITLEQVYDPEQRRYEARLHRTILTDLGYSDLRIKFARLAVESDQAKRDSAEAGAGVGAVTNGEFRKAHGFELLPEVRVGDELADGRTVVDPDAPLDQVPDEPGEEDTPPPDEDTLPAPQLAIVPVQKSRLRKLFGQPAPADPVAPEPTAPPEPPTEVPLDKVTADEAALIGKVPAGWNATLIDPAHGANLKTRPSEKTNAQPDNRGLQDGIGGRPKTDSNAASGQ